MLIINIIPMRERERILQPWAPEWKLTFICRTDLVPDNPQPWRPTFLPCSFVSHFPSLIPILHFYISSVCNSISFLLAHRQFIHIINAYSQHYSCVRERGDPAALRAGMEANIYLSSFQGEGGAAPGVNPSPHTHVHPSPPPHTYLIEHSWLR